MTMTRFYIRRVITDRQTVFFTMVLPLFMYLIFGAIQTYGGESVAHGNVKGVVMVSMALFGGITATVSGASQTIVDQKSGWGRQLAITPLSNAKLLGITIATMVVRAVLPVAIVFIAGLLTHAELESQGWILCFLMCVVASVFPFGLYGLMWALISPNDSTVGIASASVTLLAFIGNVFMPLKGVFYEISRWTPLWGVNALAHWPVSGSAQTLADGFRDESLLTVLVNIAVWILVLLSACIALMRRDRERL